jgi:bifunctional non-homologous end joining protein LigD
VPLAEYRRKRDPTRTAEPMGNRQARRSEGFFVVQKHAARRLHYDFRLAMGGVLKSWAVPKGPSVDPAVKRLAVAVEDHPLDYADFEGDIPKGDYGAGRVIVWDRGPYRVRTEPAAQLASGRLEVELEGEKLRGTWVLVRTGGRRRSDGRDWLLIKKRDEFAGGPEPTETRPESVVSGHSLDGGNPSPALESRLSRYDLRRMRPSAKALPLMLATLRESLPAGGGWLYEIKWDGVRMLALRHDGRVRLYARTGADVTVRYPEIAAQVAELVGGDLALDGEIVALDGAGRPSFERLQRRMHLVGARDVAHTVREIPATAYVFDCLVCEGRDLRSLPLHERKGIAQLILQRGGAVRYCDHVATDGAAFLEEVCAAGLEGVVVKRAESRYRGGRSGEWCKIKCHERQEFVIGGYTDPKGARAHLGALHLGVYEGSDLVHVGRTGSGLSTAGLDQLGGRLRKLSTARCPFTRGDPPRGREHHWVRPELVCEVRFSEWTSDGHLRHPVFLGLRSDRSAASVRRERAARPRA